MLLDRIEPEIEKIFRKKTKMTFVEIDSQHY